MKIGHRSVYAALAVTGLLVTSAVVLEAKRYSARVAQESCQSKFDDAIALRSRTDSYINRTNGLKAELLQIQLGEMIASKANGSNNGQIAKRADALMGKLNTKINEYESILDETDKLIPDINKTCDTAESVTLNYDAYLSIVYILSSISFFVLGALISTPLTNFLTQSGRVRNRDR